MTLIAAISVTFSAYMVISLAAKEPTALMYEATLPVVFIVALLMTRALLTLAAERTMAEGMSKAEIAYSIFGVWTFNPILNKSCSGKFCDLIKTED